MFEVRPRGKSILSSMMGALLGMQAGAMSPASAEVLPIRATAKQKTRARLPGRGNPAGSKLARMASEGRVGGWSRA